MEVKQGVLYVVGTPIGNMADVSERAVYTLKNVDFVAAEDTRTTGLFLSKLGIKNKLTSYHEHNIATKTSEVIERLQGGESCALVTDAGMPCISDPGEVLVRQCRENGVEVCVVPGACAVTSALAVSGFPATRFTFEGFLPPSKRKSRLEPLKDLPHTLIFYESPHKLRKTLEDLYSVLGDRKTALCRELTKLYEEVQIGSLSEFIMPGRVLPPKGEYVIIVEGVSKPPKRTKINKYAQKKEEES
jgi:16S rRNA (cytidine1402-2'-O)-methyltransferase